MKKLVLTVFALMVAIGAQASTNSKQGLIKRIKSLNGATGKVTSNLEQNTTGVCTVEIQDDGSSVSLYLRGTGLYFTPVAHIGADAELVDKETVLVSTKSARPGGDACGDAGGSMNYKKTVSLKGRVLKIEENFRCVFEGFKKYNLVSTCAL